MQKIENSLEYASKLVNARYQHVLEFGVYKGQTIKQLKQLFPKKQIFGFDSFEGLPEDWRDENGNVLGNGKYSKGCMSCHGQVPKIDGVKLYKGWFENTLPEYLKIAEPIALLHIDCDLYSSTSCVLHRLNKYIVEGTVIVFDEWFYNHDPKYNNHEQKAFYDWLTLLERKAELIDFVDSTNSGEERQIVLVTY